MSISDQLDLAWGLIANASGGDWTKESAEWRAAAEIWRDAYATPASNLEVHAERELRLAGLFDKDSDYDGELGKCVIALVRAFAGHGHSGGSASRVLEIFGRVARWKALGPLTSDPSEWDEIPVTMLGRDEPLLWQNKRQSSCFSRDGGVTYWDVDEKRPDGLDATIRTSAAPIPPKPKDPMDSEVMVAIGKIFDRIAPPHDDEEADDGPGIETTDEGC